MMGGMFGSMSHQHQQQVLQHEQYQQLGAEQAAHLISQQAPQHNQPNVTIGQLSPDQSEKSGSKVSQGQQSQQQPQAQAQPQRQPLVQRLNDGESTRSILGPARLLAQSVQEVSRDIQRGQHLRSERGQQQTQLRLRVDEQDPYGRLFHDSQNTGRVVPIIWKSKVLGRYHEPSYTFAQNLLGLDWVSIVAFYINGSLVESPGYGTADAGAADLQTRLERDEWHRSHRSQLCGDDAYPGGPHPWNGRDALTGPAGRQFLMVA